jgi:hypothetical protein
MTQAFGWAVSRSIEKVSSLIGRVKRETNGYLGCKRSAGVFTGWLVLQCYTHLDPSSQRHRTLGALQSHCVNSENLMLSTQHADIRHTDEND